MGLILFPDPHRMFKFLNQRSTCRLSWDADYNLFSSASGKIVFLAPNTHPEGNSLGKKWI